MPLAEDLLSGLGAKKGGAGLEGGGPGRLPEGDRAFKEAGHGGRATYFIHAKKLQTKEEVPLITLKHGSSPDSLEAMPDYRELLRQRFEQLGKR
jgi:hypothetical protein